MLAESMEEFNGKNPNNDTVIDITSQNEQNNYSSSSEHFSNPLRNIPWKKVNFFLTTLTVYSAPFLLLASLIVLITINYGPLTAGLGCGGIALANFGSRRRANYLNEYKDRVVNRNTTKATEFENFKEQVRELAENEEILTEMVALYNSKNATSIEVESFDDLLTKITPIDYNEKDKFKATILGYGLTFFKDWDDLFNITSLYFKSVGDNKVGFILGLPGLVCNVGATYLADKQFYREIARYEKGTNDYNLAIENLNNISKAVLFAYQDDEMGKTFRDKVETARSGRHDKKDLDTIINTVRVQNVSKIENDNMQTPRFLTPRSTGTPRAQPTSGFASKVNQSRNNYEPDLTSL